jgi:hypothetical protein
MPTCPPSLSWSSSCPHTLRLTVEIWDVFSITPTKITQKRAFRLTKATPNMCKCTGRNNSKCWDVAWRSHTSTPSACLHGVYKERFTHKQTKTQSSSSVSNDWRTLLFIGHEHWLFHKKWVNNRKVVDVYCSNKPRSFFFSKFVHTRFWTKPYFSYRYRLKQAIFLNGFVTSEPRSSVGIATGYALDGLGIEYRWGRDFPHLSRPALGPTQPPVQCVPGLSWGKKRRGHDADPSPPSSAVVMIE